MRHHRSKTPLAPSLQHRTRVDGKKLRARCALAGQCHLGSALARERHQERDLLHLGATRSSVVHVNLRAVQVRHTDLHQQVREKVAKAMLLVAKIP